MFLARMRAAGAVRETEMAVLGGVIIGFACLFYALCLVHFGRELRGSQSKLTGYGMRSLTVPARRVAIEMPAIAVATRAIPSVAGGGHSESEVALGDPQASAQVIPTYRKNGLLVFASGTARLAEKRAAKG
jgi:hypothetical protein